MEDRFLCPVCGYPNLSEPPWSNGSPSDEICPSCGTHFGYDDAAGGDAAKREEIYRRRRDEWRSAGSRWFSVGRPPPPGWDPESQLDALDE
jgi:rubredoxin